MINLKQKELKEWQEKNFPRERYETMSKEQLIDMILAMQFTLGMAEEIGEVAHHILKGVQGIRGGVNGIDKKQVADGFGDTIVFGEQLCSSLNINAEEEVSEVIENVLKRDWVTDPSGKKMEAPIQTLSMKFNQNEFIKDGDEFGIIFHNLKDEDRERASKLYSLFIKKIPIIIPEISLFQKCIITEAISQDAILGREIVFKGCLISENKPSVQHFPV